MEERRKYNLGAGFWGVGPFKTLHGFGFKTQCLAVPANHGHEAHSVLRDFLKVFPKSLSEGPLALTYLSSGLLLCTPVFCELPHPGFGNDALRRGNTILLIKGVQQPTPHRRVSSLRCNS